MRFATALVAVSLATVTLTSEIANPCRGGEFRPRPQVMMVTTHGFIKNHKWQRRAFVVLDEVANTDGKLKWVWLGPGTYDSTEVAELAPLDTPVEFTLAGPTGTRVV